MWGLAERVGRGEAVSSTSDITLNLQPRNISDVMCAAWILLARRGAFWRPTCRFICCYEQPRLPCVTGASQVSTRCVWELEEHLEAFFPPLDAAAEADGFHGSASLLSSTVHQQMHRLQASRRVMSLAFRHVLESWQNLKAALPLKVFANSKWMATVLWILP